MYQKEKKVKKGKEKQKQNKQAKNKQTNKQTNKQRGDTFFYKPYLERGSREPIHYFPTQDMQAYQKK